MATAASRVSNCSVSSAKSGTGTFRIVQVDGIVALKIIKHFEQSGGLTSTTSVTGVLVGMLEGDTLEITNSFAYPPEESNEDYSEYQREMLKKLRKINIDQLPIGFYNASLYGYFQTKDLLADMHTCQSFVDESVGLIYDSTKTANGTIGLRAYRMKNKFLKMYDLDMPNAVFHKAKINFEEVFEELPIRYKNSHLIRCFLGELGEKYPLQSNDQQLKLGVSVGLDESLHVLFQEVDRLSTESARHVNFYKAYTKQQQQRVQYQQRKEQENLLREKRGEPPLPQEDLDKLFKLPTAPARLDNVIASSQLQSLCRDVQDLAAQNFCKLFLAEAFHAGPSSESASLFVKDTSSS